MGFCILAYSTKQHGGNGLWRLVECAQEEKQNCNFTNNNYNNNCVFYRLINKLIVHMKYEAESDEYKNVCTR
jgi:hypothetical protein